MEETKTNREIIKESLRKAIIGVTMRFCLSDDKYEVERFELPARGKFAILADRYETVQLNMIVDPDLPAEDCGVILAAYSREELKFESIVDLMEATIDKLITQY